MDAALSGHRGRAALARILLRLCLAARFLRGFILTLFLSKLLLVLLPSISASPLHLANASFSQRFLRFKSCFSVPVKTVCRLLYLPTPEQMDMLLCKAGSAGGTAARQEKKRCKNTNTRRQRAPARAQEHVALAAAHSAQSQEASEEHKGEASFVGKLKHAALGLHTQSQTSNGRAEESERKEESQPKLYRSGYVRFLVENKAVHDALESAIDEFGYTELDGTGLERAQNLAEDLQWLRDECGDTIPEPLPDGPGTQYAALLRQLAGEDPPRFLCHYYNLQFAHAAGGRMIGKMVSENVFDGARFRFYKYDDGLKTCLDRARSAIDSIGNRWTEEEQQRGLDETPTAFDYGGTLLKLITQPEGEEAEQYATSADESHAAAPAAAA